MKMNNYFKTGLMPEGITFTGAGCYIIFLRPPLLPEDFNYIATGAIEVNSHVPGVKACGRLPLHHTFVLILRVPTKII